VGSEGNAYRLTLKESDKKNIRVLVNTESFEKRFPPRLVFAIFSDCFLTA
jgi:hypothetical protein